MKLVARAEVNFGLIFGTYIFQLEKSSFLSNFFFLAKLSVWNTHHFCALQVLKGVNK